MTRRRVLLLQLDGKLPNLALMRIAAHHREQGDVVKLRRVPSAGQFRGLFDADDYDRVYASLIFQKTRSRARELLAEYPHAIIGGTGWDDPPLRVSSLAAAGIPEDGQHDYAAYPGYRQSIGFTQRGCRLKCSFCVVPWKEGKNRGERTIHDIWRGEPHPREIVLLDNDFFGQPAWRERIAEIRDGGFKVSFTQGINVRLIGDEEAAAIASVDYRDDSMKNRRIYTAWDSRRDEDRLFAGLRRLTAAGVKPDAIMVYVLVGYDHAAKAALPRVTADDVYRVERLRDFGCRPYPMPYVRPPELIWFQRWAMGGYHKRFNWERWRGVHGDPRRMNDREQTAELFPELAETPPC